MKTTKTITITFASQQDLYIHHAGIDYPNKKMKIGDKTITFTTTLDSAILERRIKGCGDDGLVSIVVS